MFIGISGPSIVALNLLLQCVVKDACDSKAEMAAERENSIVKEEVQAEPEAPQTFDPLQVARFAAIPQEVQLNVPFTSQAPHKDWSSQYAEACEEASLAMVEFYLRQSDLSPNNADIEINYLVQLEERRGWGVDISSQQVATLAAQTYRRNYKIYTGNDVTIATMKSLLAKGYPIILPVAGRDLGNPNFQGEGPPYHMIVLTGYNENSFYAHDPGTQFGAHYEYPQDVIQNAIHEWTGSKETVYEGGKAMLVLDDPRINTGYVTAYSF